MTASEEVKAADTAILVPFPRPPKPILDVLARLQILDRGDPRQLKAAGDLTNLPRPWAPATCNSELRDLVWHWCDAVATWLNHEYPWRPVAMIPPCWPLHAHIGQELPVLAFMRWNAEQAAAPHALEEWHRNSLPLFLDRMAERLGESTCRTGKHIDRPADSRHAAFTNPDAIEDRRVAIYLDTHRPRRNTNALPD
jgi:hypothetical protein